DDAHFAALLNSPVHDSHVAPEESLIDLARVQALRLQAPQVSLPSEVLNQLQAARQHAAGHAQTVSDRRWRQLVALLKLQAASRNADQVSPWDLWLLPFVLASAPDDVPVWTDFFLHRVAHTAPVPLDGLERAVAAFEQQLDIERRAPVDAQDDSAGKVALARSISAPSSGESEMVRITSERAQRHYSSLHIAARLDQCDALMAQVKALFVELEGVAAQVIESALAHDWLPPSWCGLIETVHTQRCASVAALQAQLQTTRDGFASLPLDESSSGTQPTPVTWDLA
ncbi:MAG: ATPase, partial [Hydrogenophaga sp.]